MPAPKTANGLQVEMRFTFDGEPTENVFHVLTPAEPNAASFMQPVAEVFRDWWSLNLLGSFSPTIALREVYVLDMTVQNGQTYTSTPGAPLAGTYPGPAMPNNTALVATKRTMFSGRSFRGRTYFAGIPEAVVTGNYVSGSYVTDMNNDCAQLLVLLEELGCFLGVLSKARNKAWLPVGIITPVSTFALRNARVDSQRNRLPA